VTDGRKDGRTEGRKDGHSAPIPISPCHFVAGDNKDQEEHGTIAKSSRIIFVGVGGGKKVREVRWGGVTSLVIYKTFQICLYSCI